jgi:hypothetical protein
VPTCGYCPLNGECVSDDKFCSPNPAWDDPVLTVSDDITVPAGEPVTLTASATSPVGNSIERIEWHLGDGTEVEGATITHVYMSEGGSAFVATATATDSDEQTTDASVKVTICRLAGSECYTSSDSGGRCCSNQCVDQGNGTEVCQ